MPLAHHIDGRKTGILLTGVHHGRVDRERQGPDPVSALGPSTRHGQDLCHLVSLVEWLSISPAELKVATSKPHQKKQPRRSFTP
ncbi:hypothetical protein PGA1_c33055 [Phaeobacter inhibens DSM 17395]|nr:hypothetical protein PGA1_c33055 [Phaeobacter inhibens DSM 17395]